MEAPRVCIINVKLISKLGTGLSLFFLFKLKLYCTAFCLFEFTEDRPGPSDIAETFVQANG